MKLFKCRHREVSLAIKKRVIKAGDVSVVGYSRRQSKAVEGMKTIYI